MSSENGKTSVINLQEKGILLVEDGNHGEYRPLKNEFCEIGTAFIRAADLGDGEVGFGSAEKINTDATLRIRKGIGKEGDVLISHKGTLGKIGFVREGSPPFVCSPQTTFWRVLNEQVIDRYYLFVYMRSPQFKRVFSVCGGETDMAPYVSLTSQRLIELRLPQIGIQRAIGKIVRSLDDKIELNRKTNETLEAMAKALFKSWFVDFDPVRAKAEGRPTGLPAEISDLFPDSFEDSELGEIPSGWQVGCLSDCCEITMGQSPPGDTYNDEGVGLPFYQGKTDFGFRFPGRRIYCSSPTRRASIGATLISVRAPVGSANIAREVCSIGRGIAALKSRQFADSFIYYLIGTLQGVFESYNSEGTVFGAINGKDLASIQVVAPSTEVIAAFNSQCLPLDESIQSNTLETEHLTTIRDTLLPKLISGEIRIPDAEKMLEEVGL